jgi:hypothetical protein
MVIANPIYDVVFKRMMENEKVAKFFIGTLLEETIETIEVKPQEFTYVNELIGVAVFRLDFIATIKTKSGELKKVLIEIQKAKNLIDIMRFRNYLASQYGKEDDINGEKVILPITTIYILGFKLPEITSPCLKVERNYKDLINNSNIDTKSDFIEKLTHDSYVVQVGRITGRYQTKLDKLLSLFEQANFTDERKIVKDFNHEIDNEDIKILADILHYSGTDKVERKKLETEQEAWRSIDAMTENLREKVLKQNEELAEKDKSINEKDKLIEELMKKLNDKK